MQGGSDILRRDAQRCQLGIGEFHENLFRLLAKNVDLFHAGNVKHVLTDRLGLAHEVTHRHPLRLQGIKGEADVGVFVIDERADHAGGKVSGFIAKFLARLVELPLNGRGWRIVLERHGQESVAGACGRFHTIVPGQFLNTLFERLGDKILHFARSRSRPNRGNGKCLDGE
ncbi:hypothetical protein D3C71_1155550 [compost metagenome]